MILKKSRIRSIFMYDIKEANFNVALIFEYVIQILSRKRNYQRFTHGVPVTTELITHPKRREC